MMDLWHGQAPRRLQCIAHRLLRILSGLELQSSLWGAFSTEMTGKLNRKALTNTVFLVWIQAALRVFIVLPCDAHSLPFRHKFGVQRVHQPMMAFSLAIAFRKRRLVP